MGREQRRKELKKNKNITPEKQEQLDTSIKGSTIVILTIVVALVIIALYFISAIFITKEINISSSDNKTSETENSDTDASTVSTSVSNKILASNIFGQKEESYYVYFYDFSNEDENVKTIIDSRSDIKIYRVDTKSSLNKNYVTEESGNKNVTGIDNLKVKNPTVLEVTNDKVTAYYEGSKNIIDNLSK